MIGFVASLAAGTALVIASTACSQGTSASSFIVPVMQAAKPEDKPMRRVDITMLGSVAAIKGMEWPPDPEGRWLSRDVSEPCELILRLPGGRVLDIRTRPILIVSRECDVVVTVQLAPADTKPAWLAHQAREMERLLAEWKAVPNERMKALIGEFKSYPDPTSGGLLPNAGIERVGSAMLDEHTEVIFEMVVVAGGKWTMVALIEAGPEDRARIFQEMQVRTPAATRPADEK